jgi:hypothetical protein
LSQDKDESSKKWKTKVTAVKSAPKKRGPRPQKEDAVVAPKVKKANGVVVVATVAKGDDGTDSESSE